MTNLKTGSETSSPPKFSVRGCGLTPIIDAAAAFMTEGNIGWRGHCVWPYGGEGWKRIIRKRYRSLHKVRSSIQPGARAEPANVSNISATECPISTSAKMVQMARRSFRPPAVRQAPRYKQRPTSFLQTDHNPAKPAPRNRTNRRVCGRESPVSKAWRVQRP